MDANFKCRHDGCKTIKHKAKGYCIKHYEQFKKHGKTFKTTCKDFNEVIDKGTHYELILLDAKINETGRAKIDKSDLPRVKAIGRWCLDKHGYVFSGGSNVFMHRIVMKAKDEEVDHINTGIRHRSDNRKKNLRLATHQENKFNKNKLITNTSGFKGVSHNKPTDSWRAKITISGKQTHLGLFGTVLEANAAYNIAAQQLHGRFTHKSIAKSKKLIFFKRAKISEEGVNP